MALLAHSVGFDTLPFFYDSISWLWRYRQNLSADQIELFWCIGDVAMATAGLFYLNRWRRWHVTFRQQVASP